MFFRVLRLAARTCPPRRSSLAPTDMSRSPDPNSEADQNIWGPLNIRPALLPARRKPGKTKKAKENPGSRNMSSKVEKSRKRNSSGNLDPFPSDSKHGAPPDLSLESTQPVKNKRRCTLSAAGSPASVPGDGWDVDSGFCSETSLPTSGRSSPCVGVHPSMLVAMDCEMVGTGPNGQRSELARCSLVNYSGTVIYDKYILPQHPVTNFRTPWSGIRKEHLVRALPFTEAREEILRIIKGKVLIGHALHNDFRVLRITFPHHMIRDTCSMRLLRQLYGASRKCVSLKKLSSKLLNRSIQVGRGGHCSVEDALAALDLYKLVEEQWEKFVQNRFLNADCIPEPEPVISLEDYMQDQYWPDSMDDFN